MPLSSTPGLSAAMTMGVADDPTIEIVRNIVTYGIMTEIKKFKMPIHNQRHNNSFSESL